MFFRRRRRRRLEKQAAEEISRVGRDQALERVELELEANYRRFKGESEGIGVSYQPWGYEGIKLTRRQAELQMYKKILLGAATN